jgi:SAM-dependent methyltransferase
MINSLLDDDALERSEVVANSVMNRQRNLLGGNSYQKELGIDPLAFLRGRLAERQRVSWLDLCCGAGRALVHGAELYQLEGLSQRIALIGVDLIPMFDPIPDGLDCIHFEEASLAAWETTHRFDLITCVHGLHYIGDKLGLIQRAAGWLREGGLFLAHLDYDNLRLNDGTSVRARIGRDLRGAGFRYLPKRRILTCNGPITPQLPYRYLGADDRAGPNYTGQPAVNSCYERSQGHAQRGSR